MTRLTFTAYGVPVPQGSKTAFARIVDGKAKAWLMEGSDEAARKRHAAWRKTVKKAAKDARKSADLPIMDGPVAMTIDFVIPRPKGKSPSSKRHASKPDGDKLERSILDAVTGTLITDDARVVECHWRKRYDRVNPEPRAVITIEHVNEGILNE